MKAENVYFSNMKKGAFFGAFLSVYFGLNSIHKKIFSNGGRVLNVTSLGNNLINTRKKCLYNLNKIGWGDGFFRKDIGWRIIEKK